MQLALVAVGALRPACRELCDDYVRRLGHYARVTEREVKEAKRLRAAIPAGTLVVATTRDGQPWSSRDLAARLERWQLTARPVAVVIGGSNGLDPAFLTSADHRWSLGPLTLPHELARVVVAEQLYRAFTILKGEPYHKGKR